MSDGEYKVHFFICTNFRTSGKSCGPLHAQELRDQLKARCKQELGEAGKKVRINSAGCLGQCERGIAAVMYPQGEWFLDQTNDPKVVENMFESVRKNLVDRK